MFRAAKSSTFFFQFFIALSDDLSQCRSGHAVLLELLKRAACFDGLMLAHVADKKHLIFGFEAGKKFVYVLECWRGSFHPKRKGGWWWRAPFAGAKTIWMVSV